MKRVIPLILLIGVCVLASADGGRVSKTTFYPQKPKTVEQIINEIASMAPNR